MSAGVDSIFLSHKKMYLKNVIEIYFFKYLLHLI